MKKFKSIVLIGLLHITHTAVAMDSDDSGLGAITSLEKSKLDSSPALKMPDVNEMNLKYVTYRIECHRESPDDYKNAFNVEVRNNPAQYVAERLQYKIEKDTQDYDMLNNLINQYLLFQTITTHNQPCNEGQKFYKFMQNNPPKTPQDVVDKFLQTHPLRLGQKMIDNEIGQLFEERAYERPAQFQFAGINYPARLKRFILDDDRTFGEYFGFEYMEYYLKKREDFQSRGWRMGEYKAKRPTPPAAWIISRTPIQDLIKNLNDFKPYTSNNHLHRLFNLSDNWMKDPCVNDKDVLNNQRELTKRYKHLMRIAHPDKNPTDTATATTLTQALADLYLTIANNKESECVQSNM